jgi:hypothetical protein
MASAAQWIKNYRQTGQQSTLKTNAAEDGPIAMVDPLDVGEIGACLLALDDPSPHNNRKYVVSGPEDMDGRKIVKMVEKLAGVEVEKAEFKDMSWIDELAASGAYLEKVLDSIRAGCSVGWAGKLSGQPARGTEIIGLQHTNSKFHRNVFIEDGLVALVTSYHKGYTCTGSTKIIHRYLPKELSELVVYYLWIIHPFLRELDLLIPGSKPLGSSFLWPDGEGSWNSQRLSTILKRETINAFKAPMTIPIYRHVAIAISRRHLNGGGFKRDYDIGDRVGDLQTTHTSWTAGRLYARGLEEVPGHVEARRAGFRAVSREWHNFLGFANTLNSRKRSPEGDPNQFNSKRRRVVENR